MSGVLFLIPVSIGLALVGLAAFFWNMGHDQYADPDGDAARILSAPDMPARMPSRVPSKEAPPR